MHKLILLCLFVNAFEAAKISTVSDKDELWDTLLNRNISDLVNKGDNVTDIVNTINSAGSGGDVFNINDDGGGDEGGSSDDFLNNLYNKNKIFNDLSLETLFKEDTKNALENYGDILLEENQNFISSENIDFPNRKNSIKILSSNQNKLQPSSIRGPKNGQSSLVIVFDGTGSMIDDLQQLREGAKLIIEEITKREDNPIYDYIFVPFRDPQVGPKLITVDQQELLEELDKMTLYGGGDCPEYVLGGLVSALESALPRSFVYVFTDAIAKDFKVDDQVLALIQKKQTPITFLLTGFCNSTNSPGYAVYEKLAAASNGQVYDLNKRDIHEVLDNIRNSLDIRRVPLRFIGSPKADNHSIDVQVDENLKEFSVSVAGHKPDITVLNPQHEKYDKGKQVLNLDNLKVVNVEDPVPGKWNIKAGSESAHSVRLAGLSDVTFTFGFSIREPSSLTETSYRPLLGRDNFLSILPSNLSSIGNLDSVTVSLFSDGDKTPFEFTLPLKRINGSDLFITPAFPPPIQFFKIYVNGVDKNNNPMKRLLSTVIKSTEEHPPEITIDPLKIDVYEDESFSLRCQVVSLIPVKIQWKKHTKILQEIESDQSNVLEYGIKNPIRSDTGKYSCAAYNAAGDASVSLNVRVKLLPLIVTIPKPHLRAKEGDDKLEIACDVSPYDENVEVVWFFNDANLRSGFEMQGTKLVLNNIDRSFSGTYKCLAKYKSEEKYALADLVVEYPAEILDNKLEYITIAYGTPISLPCRAKGEPKPGINWYRLDSNGHRLPVMLPIEENNQILIEEMTPEMEGTYYCEAQNNLGSSVTREVHLNGSANAPPKIKTTKHENVIANVGDDVEFLCACDLCEPLTNYAWSTPTITFADDASGKIGNLSVFRDDNFNNNSVKYFLSIKDILEEHEGTYICRLENQYGFDELIIELEVMAPPQIEKVVAINGTKTDENSINVIEGKSAYIKCEVKGSPIPIVQWTKEGAPILFSQRIFTENNKTLVFSETKSSDAGIYECQAINPLGVITKNFTLLIVVPPTILFPIEPLQTAIEGQDVILPCEVHALPPPKISWLLNGNELDTSGNNEKYNQNGTNLQFNASGTDSGIYQCQAINEGGNVTQDIVLVIYVEPKIYPADDEVLKVTQKNEVVLSCDAVGVPMPEITWSYQGQNLENSTEVQIVNNGNVILKNVTADNMGAYICDAVNGVGFSQKVFYLVVHEPPKITSDFPEKLKILPNEKIIFNCDAIGNPYPEIYWLQNGVQIENLEFDNQSQKILNVDFQDANYTCMAQNSEGFDARSLEVVAIKAPEIIDGENINSTLRPTFGDSLTLECPIKNSDVIFWLKNDFETANDEKLSIPHVDEDTNGNFTCIGENEAGQANFTFEVDVQMPPFIMNKDSDNTDYVNDDFDVKDIVLHAGEDLRVLCVVKGNPRPKIEWQKASAVISSNETLHIPDVKTNDSGVFTCVAENDFGVAEKSYNIQIISEPEYENGDVEQFFESKAGETIILDCSLTGNPPPTIVWYKNDQQLNEYQEIFQLDDISASSAGIYKCIGKNPFGKLEILFHVTVQETPVVTKINANETTLTKTNVILSCKARGNPTPILAWIRNGHVLMTTARIHFDDILMDQLNRSKKILVDNHGNGFSVNDIKEIFQIDSFKSLTKYGILQRNGTQNNDELSLDLIYKNVETKKTGTYTCMAFNAIGKNEKSTSLRVLEKPKLDPSFKLKPIVDVLEGLPLLLECPVSGTPIPNIYWLRNDEQITQIDSKLVKLLDNGRKFILVETERNDSALYECIAKNPAGNVKLKYNVDILSPPTLIKYFEMTKNLHMNDTGSREIDDEAESETIITRAWEDVVLNCPINIGNPRSNIYWHLIKYTPKFQRTLAKADDSVLSIPEIKESATYTCSANNSLGFVEKTFHVIVQTPVFFDNEGDDNISVKLYHSFILKCLAQGIPEPEISWQKDDIILDEASSEANYHFSFDKKLLKVTGATKKDAGSYSCLAENKLGNAEKIFNVDIQVPVAWSPWGAWSECSTTCGLGVQMRFRLCLYPNGIEVDNEDHNCLGDDRQIQKCHMMECPINGGWGNWSNWTPCSATCVKKSSEMESIRYRYRNCDSPTPEFGGTSCLGSDTQQEICRTPYCPIDGQWSNWMPWSPCSVSCGVGFKLRTRDCSNPAPQFGGHSCKGDSVERQKCFNDPCPVNGGWSEWSSWSKCSKTCGTGLMKRTRQCINPEPKYGGLLCVGENMEVGQCRLKDCSNSDLTKNLPDSRNKYTPFMSFDVVPLDGDVKLGNTRFNEEDRNKKFEFAEGPSVQYNFRKEVESKIPKVIVTLEQLIPLTNDITEINFNTGNANFVCETGMRYSKEKSSCIDIDECSELPNPCSSYQTCMNTIGSYKCDCQPGFSWIKEILKCLDINECSQKIDNCSHYCENTIGGYNCLCPENYILNNDGLTCMAKQNRSPRDKTPDYMNLLKSVHMICPDGYHIEEGFCYDTDECLTMEDDCSFDQRCLNTKGSYFCIPTPCPDDYERDERSGQCVQLCNTTEHQKCKDGAKIAQTISYTILSRTTKIDIEEPILKLISYDIHQRPIEDTTFSFIENSNAQIFTLETFVNRKGIAYMYEKNKLRSEKVYKIKIIGHSYDADSIELLYITRFIIYLYIL